MKRDIPIPSISVLRCFEAAARYQSFTAAAEELGLTQSGVSRQVKELEDQIGAALFRREGRGIRLTHAGKSLSDSLFSDLTRLRRTISQAVAAGETQELLSIAALPTFATRWLVPRLKNFKARRPNLDLMVYSRSEPFDLVEQGTDVAIHFGTNDWPGAKLTPLCPEDLVVVAAPALIKANPISENADILNLPLLHMTSRPHLWKAFQKTVPETTTHVQKGSYFDQFSLIIAAAAGGMGAAILPTYLIEVELASGALVELGTVEDGSGHNYYIATPPGELSPPAAEFVSWIRKQVSRRV
ncbi:LysR substrate-binding domain-containing protein [Roseibium sp. SCP14]|uniref:LysR substrate-binding domain-containing protein n=1 Tax=Roseibium sp. SCP14 TaxID=3141375 RepID=UPI00333CCB8B